MAIDTMLAQKIWLSRTCSLLYCFELHNSVIFEVSIETRELKNNIPKE